MGGECGVQVIFTGSQIPFCKTFSDARRNLLFSISLAATMDIPEVPHHTSCRCSDVLSRCNCPLVLTASLFAYACGGEGRSGRTLAVDEY